MRSLLPRVASLRAVAVTASIAALCCGVARAATVSLTTPTLTIDVGKNATGTSGSNAQVSLTTPQLVIMVSK